MAPGIKKELSWHDWKPMFKPPYSPDLFLIERNWLNLKARWFNNHAFRDEEQL